VRTAVQKRAAGASGAGPAVALAVRHDQRVELVEQARVGGEPLPEPSLDLGVRAPAEPAEAFPEAPRVRVDDEHGTASHVEQDGVGALLADALEPKEPAARGSRVPRQERVQLVLASLREAATVEDRRKDLARAQRQAAQSPLFPVGF